MSENQNHIACPICDWEPNASSKWSCSCGFHWNTFDTAAKCPDCQKQWKTTQCHSCHKHSLHEDWYKHLKTIIQQELEHIFNTQALKSS